MAKISSEEDVTDVESALKRLRLNDGNQITQDFNHAVSVLATSSRASQAVRTQLAEPLILRKFVETVECSLNDSIEIASLALRCIGNACIDNDDARTTIADEDFSWVKCCLHAGDDELRWLTVKVLYNICSDHEAAQQRCAKELMHYDLLRLCMSSTTQENPDLSLLIDLLLWITSQFRTEPELGREPLPDDVLTDVLTLPQSYYQKVTVEEFAALVQLLLDLVRFPATQTKIVTSRMVPDVWRTLEFIDAKLNHSDSEYAIEEVQELLRPLAISMLWCLSDIAAHPAFSTAYGLNDPFVKRLVGILSEGPMGRNSGSQLNRTRNVETDGIIVQSEAASNQGAYNIQFTAASQMIGNLIWKLPADAIPPLVVDERIQTSLWLTLGESAFFNDEELLHSVAGLLLQMTRGGPQVCEVIAQDDAAATGLAVLCRSNSPRLAHDGRTLLRALGKNSETIRERFGHLAAALQGSSRSEPDAD